MLKQIDRLIRPDLAALVVVSVAVLGMAWPVTRAALAIGVLLTGLALVARNEVASRRLTVAHGAVALLALLLVMSLLFPQRASADTAHYDLATLLAGLCVLAMFSVVRLSPTALCVTVALAGSVGAVVALAKGHYELGRLWGLGLNCNYLGAMLALPLTASVGLFRSQRRWWWLLPAIPCAAGIAATESRGATVAAACGIAYVVLAGRRWHWQVSLLALAAIVGYGISALAFRATPEVPAPAIVAEAAVVSPAVAPVQVPAPAAASAAVGDRSDAEIAWNNDVRLRAATLALNVATNYPLRGIGYAGFATYAEQTPSLAIYMNTHNDFLRLAAEAGLPALLVFLSLLWSAFKRHATVKDGALLAIVVCYAVTLLFANTLSNLTVTVAFWAALGLLLSVRPKEI